MSKAIAHAVEDAAKKAEQGLAQDFSKAYHGILKDTEHGATKAADHAAENEARTVDDLAKSAEHPGPTSAHDPHTGGEGGGHPGGEDGATPNAGRDQVQDPHDAGRGDDAVCRGGEPVDMATGRMYIDQTDASLPGSLPLVFTRSFESGYRAGRWMGRRWVCTFDERLEIDAEGVVHVRADRVTQAYPHPEPGEPVQASAGDRRFLDVDARGRCYTVTEPGTGLVREFTTQSDNATALLTRVRDRSGRHYDLEYDGAGTPLAIQHSGGYRLLVTTDAGRITGLFLAGAAPEGGDQELLRYGYGQDGNLTEVYNSSGLPMRFGYDAWDRITSWTDRNNSRYWYVYDALGRVVDEGGEDGSLRFTFHYGEPDPSTGLRVNSETNALGHTTRYEINPQHQVVAVIDPLGHTTRYERDPFDRLLAETDPLGRTTRYAYDGAGDLVAVTRPDGERTTAEYAGELSLPTTIVEPGGATWRQTYDEAGRRTSLTDPLGAVTRFDYDAHGHVTRVTDALGATTDVQCDAAGLPVLVTDPLGAVTRYERDAFGRVVRDVDPLGHTVETTWSVESLPVSRTAPDGSTETWTWDGEGNMLTHRDALERTTAYEYTHFETLAARTTPDGARIAFTHDAHMQLVAVTDPLGRTWEYRYDTAGRLVAESDFEGRILDYTLDAAGQAVQVHRPAVGQTHYGYDRLGRVTTKDTDGSVTVFGYDPAGHLVSAVTPDTRLTRTVDALGNPLSETVDGRTVAFAYDALGRPVRRTTPSGHATTWSFDAVGRTVNLHSSGGTLDFRHDAAGREQLRTVAGSLTLSTDWDDRHRLTGQSLRSGSAAGGRLLQRRSYTYRADGNLAAVEDLLSGRRAFDLDRTGRVTATRADGWTESYAYDPAGNLTDAHWPSTAATRDAEGPRVYAGTQLVTAGRVRYEHDAAGRVTLRQVTRLSRKPDTWRYAWNAEDQLTSVTTPDGTLWRYLYDPLGRRTAKLRLADDGRTVAERTDFTWDGPVLAEQTTHAPYLPGPHTLSWDHDGFTPLTQTETITTQDQVDRRFFAIVTDLVGTPAELVDPTTESIAWRATATLWGNTTWPPDSTTYTPLRFPGQYFDPESRLHYNLNRYYDPETARYTSPDPLGLVPAPNPDTYVDNPHAWSDPLGLSPHVSRQKQDQHVLGTSEYQKRIALGTPTSAFASRAEADAYAQHAWDHGTPVPGRPNVKDYEYGRPVGVAPRNGPKIGWQTRVRVHMDGSGKIHGHPVGPVHYN
ncbi:DUF6531 domain-containing protein [Streptacidiphilus rugosus]|uniref:DUF6531 domain-containing protein n=1 Tax=Streptacidiphilus rugosus TaxID=405783 RepID=UPI00068EFCFA|nr:DUF6531 domain-containing protein [Streptacidiphilus rugosus]